MPKTKGSPLAEEPPAKRPKLASKMRKPAAEDVSELQQQRLKYRCVLPAALRDIHNLKVVEGEKTSSAADAEKLKELFPCTFGQAMVSLEAGCGATGAKKLRIGVVLSGGQAPGGHNVIAGIYDYAKARHPGSQIYGFLVGPRGVFEGSYIEITDEYMDAYRNQGGFDMIGSGRDKIKKKEEFDGAMSTCAKLNLHGLIVIGGDDSNTNGALLAEYFRKNKSTTQVIGCPKTIDGDLKNNLVETSFGFDTACKVYANLIGNIMSDAASTNKYWHFVRLMGRSASHITLECALQTRPNLAFIGEEISAHKTTLAELSNGLADLVEARANIGKTFGVVLVPEGLVEFVPEVGALIAELNELLATLGAEDATNKTLIASKLSGDSAKLFGVLPKMITDQLLAERDPHGNVQVSKIETERLLMLMCSEELDRRHGGKYPGSFTPQSHFFGYEGRSALPSNFDSNYCYALGYTAGTLIDKGLTGYMAVCNGLAKPVEEWAPGGAPLTAMMNMERRHGADVPVIRKALTELDGPIFGAFSKVRESWKLADCFRNPGPIQFEGAASTLTNYHIDYPTVPEIAPAEGSTREAAGRWQHTDARDYSVLQKTRMGSQSGAVPLLPTSLRGPTRVVRGGNAEPSTREARIAIPKQYPLSTGGTACIPLLEVEAASAPEGLSTQRLGIVFCGRQAPGGENILGGLLAYAESLHNGSTVVGFVGGTKGLFQNNALDITKDDVDLVLNQGGFCLLGRTADKIRSSEELVAAAKTCKARKLDSLILVGGPLTHTDAAHVSEFFLAQQVATSIVAVPASVDWDMKHSRLEMSVGFDTTCKVYSELIGNVLTDALSARKYYYFIRLIGRTPSHVVLECAMQTHPNMVLIGEEAAAKGATLEDLVNEICDTICARAQDKKNYGMVLLPEGLIGHLPHFKQLISELNAVVGETGASVESVGPKLTPWSKALLESLPPSITKQLLLEREAQGTIQLSQIETERLIADMVGEELGARATSGAYLGKFSPVTHFFGYQGRSAMPSMLDCQLGYTYGFAAGTFGSAKDMHNGVSVFARGVTSTVDDWVVGAAPLTSLMDVQAGDSAWGRDMAIVTPTDVDLNSKVYNHFKNMRRSWLLDDHYRNPGPIQYQGQAASTINETLRTGHSDYVARAQQVEDLCDTIKSLYAFGAPTNVVEAAASGLQSLNEILALLAPKQ